MMAAEQKKTIQDLDLNLRISRVEYERAKAEKDNSTVTAKFGGTVKTVVDEETARFSGQPLLTVSDGGGYYVTGTLSELERSRMQIGQEVTVTYKIMMPLEGTWTVEPCGDTGSFTVTSSTGALTGELAGADATATYITLKIKGTGTAQKTLYLKTTVTSGGETYNLDSETQLYDMRGYHYFVVNGNVDTE